MRRSSWLRNLCHKTNALVNLLLYLIHCTIFTHSVMEQYKIIGHISAGAHGVILKAIRVKSAKNKRLSYSNSNDKVLAVKRVFIRANQKEISLSLIREIKSLQLLDGRNYVS